MKLKFYKEEDNNCIKIVTNEQKELEFDYIEMIRQIFDDKGIEEPEISPQYTEEEAESIKSALISDISETIDTLFDEEGEKKSEGDEEDDLASN